MLVWRHGEGYDNQGRVACRVIHYTSGWRAYLRGDPVDQVAYGSEGEAVAAAEAAWALAPEPPPRPPRREERRWVRNRWPEWAPHPGTLRKPPT